MSGDAPPGAGPEVPYGYRVAGYRITDRIGAGAWGTVHAAERLADGAPAAAKFLPAAGRPGGLSPAAAAAALGEAEAGRRLAHPRLIRTLATATVRDPELPGLDGAVVLVMERAERSLADLLADGAPLPPAVAGRLLAEVCEGLAHMHAHGWVHGDLKPANVLLMADGGARLADFGLTAELEGTHAYAAPFGTPDHVPPEWWSERTGARGVALRPASDVWAFGVLAHQVLAAGLHPFPGATPRARALAAQAYARGREPLRLDARVPGPWRPPIAACLAPVRTDRPADAGELAARLPPAPARADGADGARPPRPWSARRAAWAAGLALAGAAAAVAVAVLPTGATGTAGPAGTTGTAVTGSPTGRPTVAGDRSPGALPPGADVPAALRGPIDRAARRCPEPEVTPALLAAMVKAESGFDPAASRPETDEYGVAMWTPSVFRAWAQDGDGDGRADYRQPADAIVSMGSYVCWLAQRMKARGLHDDLPGLLAAGYRTSDKTVAEEGGVPARVAAHAAKVRRYLADYTG
ncbi:protein kinase domain-containing protein [Kitasatospora sp. NBC_01539]|uniref:protein kinase domain-containing protein n=1 Tax=Kitasatospora sp. NBC_01539 TaxID=2903577 RepID=UPI003860170F